MIKEKEKGKPGLDFLIMLQNRKSRETWHVLCLHNWTSDGLPSEEFIDKWMVQISNWTGPGSGLAVGAFLSCCRIPSAENRIKIHEL